MFQLELGRDEDSKGCPWRGSKILGKPDYASLQKSAIINWIADVDRKVHQTHHHAYILYSWLYPSGSNQQASYASLYEVYRIVESSSARPSCYSCTRFSVHNVFHLLEFIDARIFSLTPTPLASPTFDSLLDFYRAKL